MTDETQQIPRGDYRSKTVFVAIVLFVLAVVLHVYACDWSRRAPSNYQPQPRHSFLRRGPPPPPPPPSPRSEILFEIPDPSSSRALAHINTRRGLDPSLALLIGIIAPLCLVAGGVYMLKFTDTATSSAKRRQESDKSARGKIEVSGSPPRQAPEPETIKNA